MAFRIIEKGRGVKAVYRGCCTYCKCIFEFNDEDVQEKFYDQREGCTVLFVDCPHCHARKIGVSEMIARYED